MESQQISKLARVFIYDKLPDYLTYVYLIEKTNRLYLIDTLCGSASIVPILSLLDKVSHKDVIVINTHSHWDHVWGNLCFKENMIISHEKCRELLEISWETQLQNNKKFIDGKVEKALPNLTFDDKLIFNDDGIEIFYSPGHTIDSISIIDHEERILYVGDNLEQPLVYVESEDLQTYIETLRGYLQLKAQTIVAGHSLFLTEKDILETIKYLKDLRDGVELSFESKNVNKIHKLNSKITHNFPII